MKEKWEYGNGHNPPIILNTSVTGNQVLCRAIAFHLCNDNIEMKEREMFDVNSVRSATFIMEVINFYPPRWVH